MRDEEILMVAIIVFVIVSIIILLYRKKIKQIGKLNMISNRNFDNNTEYQLLKSYAGTGKKDLKRNKANSIEDAIDLVVKSTPGGEFLKNVKLYTLSKGVLFFKNQYYAVEGDVWGVNGNKSFKGFNIGDFVQYKSLLGKYRKGKIESLKDDRTCLLLDIEKNKVFEISYDNISK